MDAESESEEGEDYKVGYKKPPKHSRFRKGKSGNPKGKQKRPGNLLTGLNKILDEEITSLDGQSMTRREATVRVLVKDAMRGNAKAYAKFLRLAKRAGLLKNLEPPPREGGVWYYKDGIFKPNYEWPEPLWNN